MEGKKEGGDSDTKHCCEEVKQKINHIGISRPMFNADYHVTKPSHIQLAFPDD
jgi:hypothetical protein